MLRRIEAATSRLPASRQNVLQQAHDGPHEDEAREGVGVADQREADGEHRGEDEAAESGAGELLGARIGDVRDAEHVEHELLHHAGRERNDEDDQNGREEIRERQGIHGSVLFRM